MNALLRQYNEQGWVKIPNAIESGLLQEFKENAIKMWDSLGRPRTLFVDQVDSIDPFLRLQFNANIIQALKSIFVNPCFVGDHILIFNMFGQHSRRGGWHIDANSELNYGSSFLYKPDYKFAKVGIFFQANTPEFGGGIDAISRSQLEYSSSSLLGRMFYKARNALLIKFLEYGVLAPKHASINAGDALIFDSRFKHRTTTPEARGMESLIRLAQHPDPKIAAQKMVLYWNVSELGQEESYMYNSYRRSLEEGVESKEIYYTRYLARRFPEDYSDEYIKECHNNSIGVAQAPEGVRSVVGKKFKES